MSLNLVVFRFVRIFIFLRDYHYGRNKMILFLFVRFAIVAVIGSIGVGYWIWFLVFRHHRFLGHRQDLVLVFSFDIGFGLGFSPSSLFKA